MNNDITLKGKTYALQFSDKTGSQRRSTTDGAHLPHLVRIAHMDAVDSATKLPVKRSKSQVVFSYLDTGAVNPSPIPVTVTLTVVRATGIYQPSASVVQNAIGSLIQMLNGTSADAASLNLLTNIHVNEEQ